MDLIPGRRKDKTLGASKPGFKRTSKDRLPEQHGKTGRGFVGILLKNPLFEKRIELEAKYQNGEQTAEWCLRYIAETGTADSLRFAVQHLPEIAADLESWLHRHNPTGYARFLEDAGRLPEVVDLFQTEPQSFKRETQYDFYKRHKKLFPAEARAVFLHALDEALPEPKERAYLAVVETLRQLQVIEPAVAFQGRVAAIRELYKRRGSLMAMLGREGW